jgi:RHS repeat-associated protein
VTGTYRYDVFGAPRSQTGATTEFNFAGQQTDPTALQYLRARYYDPAVGRFISRDPQPASAAVPVTLNRYVYANNNPVNLVDPLGREAGSPTKYQLGVCEWCRPTGGTGGGPVVVVYRGGITPGQVALAGVGALALYSVVLTADEALNLVLEAQGEAIEPPPMSPEAEAVVEALRSGQPSPYAGRTDWPHNGEPYQNRDGKLPANSDPEYYTEWGVPGQERVIMGKGGEIYYTPDHYASIYRVY